MKPKIAIVANQYEFAENVFHNHPASYVPQFFLDAIAKVGGLPFILPLTNPEETADYVAQFDGFLLTGGQGVSPFLYGEEPLPKMGQTSLKRDRFEINLVKSVAKTDKPLLGVCRGMQVLNVALNGKLYQNLIYRDRPQIKHMQIPTDDSQPSHYVYTQPDNFLRDIFGKKVLVNSLHQQAVKTTGDNLAVIARSSDDVVEGVWSQDEDHRFFGVQWHPEMLVDYDARNLQIFERLVKLAKAKTSV
ncbi:MAG: gamma-glutamyl-gamma-aminobutyrate hydrolase family protein [Lactobacillus sp.]|jgi:putative glutamine amidotransferase|nr:gamma-glutamyl-gamma-aminobutyrate hydrolase family protein [Lactobacillus sp.]